MVIEQTVDATKNRIDEGQAWEMLKTASQISIAKGKKFEIFTPETDSRETILAKAMGPSGNLRAPALKVGTRFVIGFNPDLYEQQF